MDKKCQKCKHINEEEALFCAECGERLEKSSKSHNEVVWSIVFTLIFMVFIGLLMLVNTEFTSSTIKVEKKVESPPIQIKIEKKVETISIETFQKKLNDIKEKGTFETTEEYNSRRVSSIDKIPSVELGMLSMDKYDADKEELSFTLHLNKSFTTYMGADTDSNKILIMPMARESAKRIFSKEKMIKIYGKGTKQKSFLFFIFDAYYKYDIPVVYVNNSFQFISPLNSKLIGTSSWEDHRNMKIMEWQDAMDYCKDLTLDRYTDWRLPSKEELGNLYRNKHNLTYDVSNSYWSSTTYAGHSAYAWGVGFNDGYQGYYGKSNSIYVRCVRAGQ